MKRNVCSWALAILGSIVSTTINARDMDDQYAVFGVGAENCASYLVARDRGGVPERWYHQWMAGYLSAVNNAAASTFNILGEKSMADILDWLEGYCAANPNSNFTNAASDMTAILYEDRSSMAPGKKGGWNKFNRDQEASKTPVTADSLKQGTSD